MTAQHGTQPTTKPRKKVPDDNLERKRGVKPNLPPRDGTTRTVGVNKKHIDEDKKANNKEKKGGLREYD